MLLDKGLILTTTAATGQHASESACINPYAGAFVVPNPSIAKAVQPAAQRQGLDPFVVKLNSDNPYSLLKATKGWTLGVKSFTAPYEIANKNSDTSLMRNLGFGKGKNALVAGGEQAEAMAKVLRTMKGAGGQPMNLEAFVLHTRYASLVTVGQFNSPDDPALLALKRMLSGMNAKVSLDPSGMRPATNAPTLFDANIVVMPIPKS